MSRERRKEDAYSHREARTKYHVDTEAKQVSPISGSRPLPGPVVFPAFSPYALNVNTLIFLKLDWSGMPLLANTMSPDF